jgi:hypothetical protein
MEATVIKRAKQIEMPNVKLNVPLSFKQIIDIVRQLSPFEKQQLGEVLWAEQSIDDIVISEEHKQIVRERIKKHENTSGSYLSWNDIERKMATKK